MLNPQTKEKLHIRVQQKVPQEVLHKTLRVARATAFNVFSPENIFLKLLNKAYFSAAICMSNFQTFQCKAALHSAAALPLPLGMRGTRVAGVTPKFREGIFPPKFSSLKSKLLNCGFHFQLNATVAQTLISLRQIGHARRIMLKAITALSPEKHSKGDGKRNNV